jgi:hypothetical protein
MPGNVRFEGDSVETTANDGEERTRIEPLRSHVFGENSKM